MLIAVGYAGMPRGSVLLFQVWSTAVLLASVAVLLNIGVGGELRDRQGQRGRVTVTDCRVAAHLLHGAVEYRCGGPFVADAGGLRLPYVAFDYDRDPSLGAQVPVRVEGPGVDTATAVAESPLRRLLVTCGGSLGLLVVLFLIWYRPRRQRRRQQATTGR